ncbi:hypothetical protein GEA64_00870 [Photorhabdus khanii]|uniref:Phage tail collar domain-containing protein n=1 Tax=Photorhabdus khanii TaxID=1004150 RepID=A0A7C9GIB3_9GAMM|nr:phage tail protein [Photorhabdus khanii]MQL46632.1 hypothetical protein [Photorhabdus khanii]
MAKNDFKAFATGENANTLSQEEYESLGFIEEGFKSGIARSEQLNKVWRQSSIIAAVIGKYIAEKTGEDVIDDGDLEKLVGQLDFALKQKITAEIPDASLTQKGISQLNNATNSDREDQAATPKAVNDVRKMVEGKLSSVADATLNQKGIVQLSSATDSANETLAATPKAVKGAYDFANTANVEAKNAHDEANRATDNANSRLAKNQNGADIPNKSEFIKNLGLVETVDLAKGAYPGLRSVNEIPSLGYNGAFQGKESINYAKGISIGDNDYGQIWVNSSGRLFAQFSNSNGSRPGGECAYMTDITPITEKANNAVPSSRKVNGKALTGDISLNAEDVGALQGINYFSDLPGTEYQGVFSAQKASYAKGVNFGIVNYDTGRIYVNASGDLYAHFLNGNGSISGGIVNTFPVGAPIAWPLLTPPDGYIMCTGRTFDKSLYPQLATAYPSGRVPDLRGEFIRGWAGDSNIDSRREILSLQGDAIRNITGSMGNPTTEGGGNASGVFSYSYSPGGRAEGAGGGSLSFTFDASRVVPTANENRPRNIALNYIVRAA